MRAIAAGTTLRDNIELKLYYDDASRGYSEHGYIGLYSRKSVRAVGKVVKTVVSAFENGKLSLRTESGDAVTEQEIKRIKEATERAREYGYDLMSVPHRYFIVDQFFETDFRKSSKNPIQRAKFFPLAKMFGYEKMPATERIADDLSGRTWEEFGL